MKCSTCSHDMKALFLTMYCPHCEDKSVDTEYYGYVAIYSTQEYLITMKIPVGSDVVGSDVFQTVDILWDTLFREFPQSTKEDFLAIKIASKKPISYDPVTGRSSMTYQMVYADSTFNDEVRFVEALK